ncbi:MAG TPA: aldehyde dehydrogenase family protein, partial [Rhizomicrobium sp.]|nr:aldehyde dehydrogenase family protein [Rhizomicrobium sp.]
EPRMEDIAQSISREMGAPIAIARGSHAPQGLGHFREAIAVLKTFRFEEPQNDGRVVREPIGVAALITPWNWPMNQMACKIAPGLAAGCTMVLKPSEIAPLSGHILAEVLHDAGVPPGVFNLVDGLGPEVGEILARHPDVDMISITGSNRAGAAVAKAAADSVKRVSQELGGKSACIVLDDVDAPAIAREITLRTMRNSGQSCAALTRLLVPAKHHAAAVEAAAKATTEIVIGDPADEATTLGPVSSSAQYDRVQGYIAKGIEEGAIVAAGGPGKPQGFEHGAYVRPTVFANVRNDMVIAQDEIFGPVICIIPYETEDDAIRIANASRYGLSGMVRSASRERALKVARRIRTGMIHVNETKPDPGAPFGGYKHSGNGREWGRWGLEEFLETKMIFGAPLD